MKKNNKSKMFKALAFLLLIIIFSLTVIIVKTALNDYKEYQEVENTQQKIIDDVVDEETVKKNVFSIDWVKLLSINSDIIAWIRIPDTNISYPVVQVKYNNQYLRKNIYGNYSKGGTPFVDANIQDPFNCANTIIYGHNLQNGTVFSQLKGYANVEYANAHNIVYIYMPDESIRQYEVISFHIVQATDKKVFNPYIENILDYEIDMTKNNLLNKFFINNEDKILTLSTCTNSGDTRYVLHCKLKEG